MTFRKQILIFLLLVSLEGLGQGMSNIKAMILAGEEDRALQQLEQEKDDTSPEWLNLKGEALLYKGSYEEALQLFESAANILEQSDNNSNELADTYGLIGNTQRTLGNNALALQYHFKRLEIYRKRNDDAGIAGSLNDIGLVYANSEEIDEVNNALMYYDEAVKLYRESLGEKDEKVSTAYVNIGLIHLRQGNYPEAIEFLDMALNIREDVFGEESIQAGFVHSNLGALYEAMGSGELARQELNIALEIYEKQYGFKHPEVASIYNLIGDGYFDSGNYAAALDAYQKALIANVELFEEEDVTRNPEIGGYYNANYLLLSLLQKARSFEQLYTTKTLKKKDLEVAYKTLQICDLLIDEIRSFRNSEADKVALGNTSADVYETAIRVSLAMADASWSKKEFREKAFYYSDKSKSSVLLASIADSNAKSFAGIPDALVDEEQQIKTEVAYYEQKLADKPERDMEQQYRAELFKWTKAYNDLIERLENDYPAYYNLKHNTSIPSIPEIQDRLESNAAVLSYFVGRNSRRLYTFLITKEKFRVFDRALDENYDREIAGYRNAMYYQAGDTYRSSARNLYLQLIPGNIPSNIDRLIVVPSGRMATIPFEALITDKVTEQNRDFANLPYLINDYIVSYQYSVSLLLNPSIESSARESIALFAPVEFKSQTLSTLPGTEQEVNDIANLFAGSSASVEMFLKHEATPEAVKSEQVERSKYLHFATHGIIDEDKPAKSQICLASFSDEDGHLYSGDIYNLQLSADLVVLSACETGLGKISRGEGIIGLTRALIFAGSNNLLVSLWSVNDASTSYLMTDFYRAMLQGNDYETAVRYAKLGIIKSGKYSFPYYWAPFVLVGQ